MGKERGAVKSLLSSQRVAVTVLNVNISYQIIRGCSWASMKRGAVNLDIGNPRAVCCQKVGAVHSFVVGTQGRIQGWGGGGGSGTPNFIKAEKTSCVSANTLRFSAKQLPGPLLS